MKILVTGATGFIGRSLIPALMQSGHQVGVSLRQQSMELFDRVESCVVGELGGSTRWDSALDGVEAVVHLAGLAHVTRGRISGAEAASFQEINVVGTQRLVEACVTSKVKKFVFMSSLHAVASHSEVPVTERTIPHPDSTYARSKLESEQIVREVFSQTQVGWTILRPPLVYGPGQKANMEKLVALVLKGVPLPFGSIHNRRSLIGVQNLTDLILKCLSDERANLQTFLCSDGVPLSTSELIMKIASTFNKRAILVPVPEPLLRAIGRIPGLGAVTKLMDSLYVDDLHVQTCLEWKPPLTLEEGLRKMWK